MHITSSQILETGIDKLVNIIKERGKVTVSEAAKELEVSPTVIMERASFLEEEGLIIIDYRPLKTFLVSRELTRKEIESKAKEFKGNKDILVRKAEGTLKFFAREEEKFKDIKKEFIKLKKELGFDIDYVRKGLKEIEKCNMHKLVLDQKIKSSNQQIKKLNSFAKKIASGAKREKKEIEALLNKAKEQRKNIIKIQKSKKTYIKFLNFTNKKINNLRLMEQIDKDRNELEKEFSNLVKKAKAFQLASQSMDVGKEMSDIESRFKNISQKKSDFEARLKKLTKILEFRVFNNN